MNHQKVYETIIYKAKSENRIKLRKNQENYVYYENHHIFPKCLGGGNENFNLVLLTAKEHFICHKLLTYIYKGNRALCNAFHRMCYGINKKKLRRDYKVSSRDYKYARELYSLTKASEKTRKKMGDAFRGRILSEEHKKKVSESIKRWHNEVGHSEETRKKIGDKHRGRKCTKEQKENYKKGNKGKNIGVKHSLESCKRASEKLKGRPAWNKGKKDCYSIESRLKMSEAAKKRKRKNE